jgi:hypothetical protein
VLKRSASAGEKQEIGLEMKFATETLIPGTIVTVVNFATEAEAEEVTKALMDTREMTEEFKVVYVGAPKFCYRIARYFGGKFEGYF